MGEKLWLAGNNTPQYPDAEEKIPGKNLMLITLLSFLNLTMHLRLQTVLDVPVNSTNNISFMF